MTRSETLDPLLGPRPTRAELVAQSNYLVFRDVSARTAFGLVVEDARRYGPAGARRLQGWNAAA